MLASLLRIILLTATLKILERGLDKGPIIDDIIKLQKVPNNWKLILGKHTLADDIKAANTKYSQGTEYQINCQRCV